MKNYLIAERYAEGLNAAIADDSQVEAIREALDAASETLQASRDLQSALTNPALREKVRHGLLDAVLARLEPPVEVARFLHYLLARGRIMLLPEVADVFEDKVNTRLNRITARVTTSVPLTDVNLARIQEGLERYSGKTVHIRQRVNPKVLGGAVAKIGGTIIDGSLRGRLQRLRAQLIAEETYPQ